MKTREQAMIEEFDPGYKNIFNEPDYMKRWKSLKTLYKKDYGSFRVLFVIEVLSLIDKWDEPSVEDLNHLLNHVIEGNRMGIRIGSLIDLFTPVWPLEVAKYDLLLLKTFSNNYKPKNYFFTSIKITTSALVQIWWAFETLMNDFASIIVEQRKESLNPIDVLFLTDKNVILNDKGVAEERVTYQPILARIQYINKILTNESIDRTGKDWQNIVNLKSARDTYIHRLAKETKKSPPIPDKKLIMAGFKSIQKIIAQVFEKTPEFSDKFVYKFLSFWSCNSEQPFMWDGKDGDSFYLGLTEMEPEAIVNLFAPMPSSLLSLKNK